MKAQAIKAQVRLQRGIRLKQRCQVAQPMQQLPMAPKNILPLKSSASSSCDWNRKGKSDQKTVAGSWLVQHHRVASDVHQV